MYTHEAMTYLAGSVSSAVVGYPTVRFLLRFFVDHSLRLFAYYRFALAAVLAAAPYEVVVQASSRDNSGMPMLQSWLVEPAEVFSWEVLQRSESAATVLTSATLAVGRSFAYPKGRLGFDRFDGSVRELRGREIFDYERNSLVYVE